jgi:hypothetical protein
MGNIAFDTWDGEKDGGPRWDADILSSDHDHIASQAQEHADKLGLRISGLESALSTGKPHQRAWVRNRNAPLYYDFHRTTLASDPRNVPQHMRTLELAKRIATIQPPDLGAALNAFGDIAEPEDIEREYFLWKHSLLLDDNANRWNPSAMGPASVAGLSLRQHEPKDGLALDSALRGSYGPHTRSPQLARVAFATAHPNGAFRGTTIKPSGDMVLGTLPGYDQRTRDANRKTMIEEMAHSLVQRHLAPEAKKYSEWVKGRVRDEPDRMAHLPAFARHQGNGDDYSGVLAHTMANGLFDEPETRPYDENAPNDESMAVGSRLFRMEPTRPSSHFRSFA